MSNPVSPQISLKECARKLRGIFCALETPHFSINNEGQIFLDGNLSGKFGSWEHERRRYTAMWLPDQAIVKLHEIISGSPISMQDLEEMGVAVLFLPPKS